MILLLFLNTVMKSTLFVFICDKFCWFLKIVRCGWGNVLKSNYYCATCLYVKLPVTCLHHSLWWLLLCGTVLSVILCCCYPCETGTRKLTQCCISSTLWNLQLVYPTGCCLGTLEQSFHSLPYQEVATAPSHYKTPALALLIFIWNSATITGVSWACG